MQYARGRPYQDGDVNAKQNEKRRDSKNWRVGGGGVCTFVHLRPTFGFNWRAVRNPFFHTDDNLPNSQPYPDTNHSVVNCAISRWDRRDIYAVSPTREFPLVKFILLRR